MFQGNFTIERNELGNIEGHFKAETPAGPFVMDLEIPTPSLSGRDEKDLARELMGDMFDAASYFELDDLIGAGPATFSRKLHGAMKSRNPKTREGAARYHAAILSRARGGHPSAQDIAYGVNRLEGHDYVTRNARPGFVRNPRSLAWLNGDTLDGVLKRRAKGNDNASRGLALYRAYETKSSKAIPSHKALRKLAKHGDHSATETLGYFSAKVKAEKAKRQGFRFSRNPTLAGGFDFGSFMKDVGKVAGPVMKGLAPIAKFVPFVGPILEPAMNLASDAIAQDQSAQRKVSRINKLAEAGVPKAIKARTALKVAQKIQRAAAITDAIKTGALRPDSKEKKAAAGRKTRFQRHLMSLYPGAVKRYNEHILRERRLRKAYGGR